MNLSKKKKIRKQSKSRIIFIVITFIYRLYNLIFYKFLLCYDNFMIRCILRKRERIIRCSLSTHYFHYLSNYWSFLLLLILESFINHWRQVIMWRSFIICLIMAFILLAYIFPQEQKIIIGFKAGKW
jgi:hypothetical protein